MPKYKVEMPNGKAYYVTVPKAATDAELEAAVLRQHPEAAGPGRIAAATKGFLSGAANVLAKPAEWLVEGMAAAGVPGAAEGVTAGRRDVQLTEQALKPYRAAHPNYFTGGQIAGETAASAPFIGAGGAGIARLGGALTTKAPAVARALQATGRAVQTGGLGVQAPTRAARMALRAAGGGVAGGAQAALTDQNILDAAETGAVLPLVGAIGRRGLGWVYDGLAGRIGATKAAEIMRKLVSEHADEVRTALASATADVKANTAQFLAKADIQLPELAAATEDVSRSVAGAPLLATAQARGESIAAGREALRGAPTQTGAMDVLGEAKTRLDRVTAPKREAGLQAAEVGRNVIAPMEAEAATLRGLAGEESRTAARFLTSADRNAALLQESGLRMPAALPRQREIVAGLGGVGTAAGERSVRLGEAARNKEEAAASIRALGFQPLDVSSVVGRLRDEASNAEFVNPARFKILSAFADNLQNRANKFGGIIDAGGLYELQKNMGSAISDLLGPTDPKSLQKYTAQIIGEVKPMISSALEEAGGPAGHIWADYMDTYAKGMRQIEQADFARTLADLPEAEYTAVMRGDNPDFVKDFFGPGNYDINLEMPAAKLPGAQALASDIQAGQDVANLGLGNLSEADRGPAMAGVRARANAAMSGGLSNPLWRAGARIIGGQTGIYGTGNAAQQLEQVYANRLAEKVRSQLAPAMASPEAARNLMGKYSASDMTTNALAQNPEVARLLSLGTINYFNGRAPR